MNRDKEFYRKLAERYLDAGTSPAEEKALAEYLSQNAESEEERALARLLALEHPECVDRQADFQGKPGQDARSLLSGIDAGSLVSDGHAGDCVADENVLDLLSDDGVAEFDRIVCEAEQAVPLHSDSGSFPGTDSRRKAVTGPVRMPETSRRRFVRWTAAFCACAAAVALCVFLWPSGKPAAKDSGVEVASTGFDIRNAAVNISSFMDIFDGNVLSVTVKPAGNAALVTAEMADGTTRMYIMAYDEDEGSTSLFAMDR